MSKTVIRESLMQEAEGASYTEIRRVSLIHESLPVHLILQTRHCVPPVDFFCLSWRTVLPTGRGNRRFYYDRQHGTGIWTIPVSIALRLLNRAEAAGMFDEQYDDLQERHCGTENLIIDSRDLGEENVNANLLHYQRKQGSRLGIGTPVCHHPSP